MNFFIVIPARKNSKRFINKNISLLDGIPLIDHTIRFAISTGFPVIVSSDIEIIFHKYDSVKYHRRPDFLATDTSSTLDVLKDVINTYGLENQNIILFQPTSPFRKMETLTKMIDLFKEKNESVCTVERLQNPRFGKLEGDLYKSINYNIGQRSQDIGEYYHENGNTYIFKAKTLMLDRLYMNDMHSVEIDPIEKIDIDIESDLMYAEFLIKKNRNKMLESIVVNKKRKIGLDEPCFIIAEACDNHLGRMDYAKKMIDVAVMCGSDAIKFQHHLPDEEMLKDVPMSSNFKEPLYNILKKYSLSLDNHKELKSYCDEKGIIYMCTPFSKKAADEIEDLVDLYKIGSGELTDHPTLIEIAKKGKPMILSTGMSNIDEIEETVSILKKINNKIMILNCTSEYPPKYDDINVGLIPKLRDSLGVIVGHSDHTPDNYSCFAAVSCGAKIIEKHIILDKLHPGPDQNVSIDPMGLHDLVEGIRKIESSLGSDKEIHALEKPIKEWARRSVVSISEIKEGDFFSLDNVWTKRPGTGIPAKKLFDILGKKCIKGIEKDKLLSEENFNY